MAAQESKWTALIACSRRRGTKSPQSKSLASCKARKKRAMSPACRSARALPVCLCVQEKSGRGHAEALGRKLTSFPRPGGVAEWSNALVLKTSVPQGTVGSNPTPSAKSLDLVRDQALRYTAYALSHEKCERVGLMKHGKRDVLPR